MTSNHQPADMGIIASLKVGFKQQLLLKYLAIFEMDGGYEAAAKQRKKMKQGCKGVDYGGKPHVLDTMKIPDSIWSKNNRYAREDGIQRCWRKAEILPEDWQNQLKEQLGSISMTVKDKNKLSRRFVMTSATS